MLAIDYNSHTRHSSPSFRFFSFLILHCAFIIDLRPHSHHDQHSQGEDEAVDAEAQQGVGPQEPHEISDDQVAREGRSHDARHEGRDLVLRETMEQVTRFQKGGPRQERHGHEEGDACRVWALEPQRP